MDGARKKLSETLVAESANPTEVEMRQCWRRALASSLLGGPARPRPRLTSGEQPDLLHTSIRDACASAQFEPLETSAPGNVLAVYVDKIAHTAQPEPSERARAMVGEDGGSHRGEARATPEQQLLKPRATAARDRLRASVRQRL